MLNKLLLVFAVVSVLSAGTVAGEDNSTNDKLIVTSVLASPFLMKRDQRWENSTEAAQYEGYIVDLIELIADITKLKFRLQLSADGKYGKPDELGKWNGMIGELLDGSADLAVAPLTITRQRKRVVDFSQPFMSTGISIMMMKPAKQQFNILSFTQPFSHEIWLYILFAYICVSLVIYSISRLIPTKWRLKETTNGQFMLKEINHPGGSTEAFFEKSTVETYQRMWRQMENDEPSVLTESYDEGIMRVRESNGRYAFLLESTANEYVNSRQPCNTMQVGKLLNTIGYGIATPFNSNITRAINLAVLELQENGTLKKLHNKWWIDQSNCEVVYDDELSPRLNMAQLAGIFYILMAGIFVAIATAFCEKIYHLKVNAQKKTSEVDSGDDEQLIANQAENQK